VSIVIVLPDLILMLVCRVGACLFDTVKDMVDVYLQMSLWPTPAMWHAWLWGRAQAACSPLEGRIAK